MIFGTAEVGDGVLETSNDSYALTANTNFSVPRPLRPAGIMGAILLSAFGASFSDLLYPHEIILLGGFVIGIYLIGNRLACLTVTNRELIGSPMSVAVWGTYGHLNQIRRKAAAARQSVKTGD